MNTHTFTRSATETMEGTGAEVARLFPVPQFHNFDPFVLWDHFTVAPGTGFPDHPHRGFEAITYMLEGSMQHTDNLGNQSTVKPGGAQRFTAGKGIVHSEMPGKQGSSRGIQLWINLPQRLKGVAPAYQQVNAGEFPEETFAGGWKKIIVGEGSPLKLLTPVRYAELKLDPGGHYEEPLQTGFSGLIYLLAGEAEVNGHALKACDACFITDGEGIHIQSTTDCQLMLCQGQPHNEPIYQHGPYVD